MSPRTRLFSGPEDGRIRRALCLVAHPDDVEFFCAGTVLRMARRGVAVDLVLATSGDKGARDAGLDPDRLASTREAEQLRAAELLGAQQVDFLRHHDAEVVDTLAFRGELVAAIRRSLPDVLLTFDPTPAYRQHPDHRTVGRVALDAAWPCARDPLTYPEAGPPHETKEAWLFAGPRADLEIDVSGELETKIAARLMHRSQTGSERALRARWRRVASTERFAQVDLR